MAIGSRSGGDAVPPSLPTAAHSHGWLSNAAILEARSMDTRGEIRAIDLDVMLSIGDVCALEGLGAALIDSAARSH
ncbi:MAG: hypothetical protein MUC69_06010 [Gemmatimonadales bacterium]|nr:hypothetical protein [Gemmatimonadales bacterium]